MQGDAKFEHERKLAQDSKVNPKRFPAYMQPKKATRM